MFWLAALAASVFVHGVPPSTGALSYAQYRDLFLVAGIPIGARPVGEGRFEYIRDGVRTSFSLTPSTPHVDEREVACDGHLPSYKISKPQLFTYSCQVGERIIYHVAKYGRTYRVGASDSTETIEVDINYPAAQRSFWAPVVAHMSKALRFAPKLRVKHHD